MNCLEDNVKIFLYYLS